MVLKGSRINDDGIPLSCFGSGTLVGSRADGSEPNLACVEYSKHFVVQCEHRAGAIVAHLFKLYRYSFPTAVDELKAYH